MYISTLARNDSMTQEAAFKKKKLDMWMCNVLASYMSKEAEREEIKEETHEVQDSEQEELDQEDEQEELEGV